MASFYIPLSGLEADTTALNTIANDLANLNTTGFKAETTNFSDMFYQQIGEQGSGDLIQEGSGVGVSSIQSDFSQGSQISTDNAGNVELVGNGFFVVNDGGTNVYTRDGNFSPSTTGNLLTQSGAQVMGYPAVNGVVNTNAPLTGITLPIGQVEPALATTSFGMTANLDATAAVGATLPAQVTVYDSLGVPNLATVTYTKTAANTWSYSVSMPETLTGSTTGNTTTYNFGQTGTPATIATVNPATNLAITGPTAGPPAGTATITAPTVTPGETVATYATALQSAVSAANITGVTVTATGNQLTITGAGASTAGSVVQDPVATNNTGTLTFNADGNLVNPAADVSGISFAGLSDGAANMTMTFNILGSSGLPTITQTDVASAASASTQNGFTTGTYLGFSIAADGTVNASFSNNQTLAVGQLALANVANDQGLDLLGGGNYATTQASGNAAIGVSGSAGLGTINDDTLEASNVNISAEFSDLIIAQRAFEANSKGVTTFDTIAQETINMIH